MNFTAFKNNCINNYITNMPFWKLFYAILDKIFIEMEESIWQKG